jgi:hypothetical protein
MGRANTRNPDGLTDPACATARATSENRPQVPPPPGLTPDSKPAIPVPSAGGTQNVPVCANHVPVGIEPMTAPIGGDARLIHL